MKDMLVFSIALNGYQWLYRNNLQTQRQYAHKINADYMLIDSPKVVAMGTECCWLKIPLILAALKKGYRYVLFLDADAYVNKTAPDIRRDLKDPPPILMAKGQSDRWNSGVIYAENCDDTFTFFNHVLSRRHTDVDSKNSVGWGENGHVIQVDHEINMISELPLRWNNTFDLHLNDHIRHFSAGKLRRGIVKIFVHKALHALTAKAARYLKQRNHRQDATYLLFKSITHSNPSVFKYFHFE